MNTRLPPLKALQVFLAAAKHNSFKVAAEELYVSQAAISQQIRLLEAHFDGKLFDRINNKTQLNAKGRLLYPFIEQAFEQINLGVAALAQEPNANELKITALHSVTSLILMPDILEFQTLHPELSVQFLPNNTLTSFQDSHIDIAVRRGKGNYSGLESRKLVDDSIILVASPLLFNTLDYSLNDVVSLPLLEDTSDDIQEALSDFCHQNQLNKRDFRRALKTTDALPIIQEALAGQGMAFVSKVLVNKYIENGQLVNLFDYSYADPRTLYLVAPAHHFQWRKIKRFEHWLTDKFKSSL